MDNEAVPHLLELPSPVVSYILSFLHYKQVISFGYASRSCNRAAESDLTWMFLHKRDYSTIKLQLPLANESPASTNNNNPIWKKKYFQSKQNRREMVFRRIQEAQKERYNGAYLDFIATKVPHIPPTCGNYN